MVCLADRVLYLLATLSAGAACLFITIGAAGPWVNIKEAELTDGASPCVFWWGSKLKTWEYLLKLLKYFDENQRNDPTYPDWLLATRIFLSLAIIASVICAIMHLIRTCGAGGKILTLVAILVNIAAVVCLVISLGVFREKLEDWLIDWFKNLRKDWTESELHDLKNEMKLKLVWGAWLEIIAILLLVGSAVLAIAGIW